MTRLTLVALLGFVAGLTFSGAFRIGDIAGLCAVVAATSAAVAAAAKGLQRRFGRVPWPAVTVPFGLLSWMVVVTAAALALGHGRDEAGGYPAVLWYAVTDGPHRLLTTPPAALGSAEMLALVGTCVWWATFWSAVVTLTGARPLLSVLPQAVLAAVGSAASAAADDPHAGIIAAGFVLAVVSLLWIDQGIRGRPAEKDPSPGSARVPRRATLLGTAPALAGLAVVALLAAVAGAHLPGLSQRKPWDPRTLIKPAVVLAGDADPLSQAVSWMRSKSSDTLFTERSTAPAQPTRWLVLDVYDGRRWSSSASYAWAGASIPKPSAEQVPAGPTTSVHADIHVNSLPGPWLPVPGAVRAVSAGSALRVDTTLGALAGGADGVVTDLDYSVDVEVPIVPEAARLAQAPAGSGGALEAERRLPVGVPDDVIKWALQATAGLDPYEQLQHLASALRNGFRYDPDIAPGQSYGRLDWLVRQPGVAKSVPISTSPDVVATLFAVAAREAGFPSRLVVGFVPGAEGADGRFAVKASDARIWPEAYFSGVGWVPFPEAVPQPGRDRGSSSAPVQAIPTGPTSQNAPTTQISHGTVLPQPPVRLPAPPTAHHGGGVSSWWAIGAVAVLVVGSASALTPKLLRRRRRAARRKDPDPRRRAVWAWHDGLRWLASANVDATQFAISTPREIAATASARLGPAASRPALLLAELAEAALYAPEPPLLIEADQAWACVDQIRVLSKSRHR